MTIGNLTALRQRTRISFAIADLALLFTDIIYSLLYNCIALTDSVTTIFDLGLFIPSDFRYFTTSSCLYTMYMREEKESNVRLQEV